MNNPRRQQPAVQRVWSVADFIGSNYRPSVAEDAAGMTPIAVLVANVERTQAVLHAWTPTRNDYVDELSLSVCEHNAEVAQTLLRTAVYRLLGVDGERLGASLI